MVHAHQRAPRTSGSSRPERKDRDRPSAHQQDKASSSAQTDHGREVTFQPLPEIRKPSGPMRQIAGRVVCVECSKVMKKDGPPIDENREICGVCASCAGSTSHVIETVRQ